jgi:predicted transcriptional regulator
MTVTHVSEINVATRAVGGAIRGMRESLEMSLDDLSREVSGFRNGVSIATKTIEAVEEGITDAQLDHMLTLLAAVGIDMQLPHSARVSRDRLVEVRLAEIRTSLFKARHPKGMRKISFKALSDVSGIEQGQIGRIESGEAMPRFRTLLVLTRALGIEVRFVPIAKKSVRTPTAARPAALRRGRSQGRRVA